MKVSSKCEMYNNAMYLLQHYGINHQVCKTMEEMGGLGAELMRDINDDPRASVEKVMEEIADVEIMLMQLRLYYEGFENVPDTETIMYCKLERAVDSIPPAEIDIPDLQTLEECAGPAVSSGGQQ